MVAGQRGQARAAYYGDVDRAWKKGGEVLVLVVDGGGDWFSVGGWLGAGKEVGEERGFVEREKRGVLTVEDGREGEDVDGHDGGLFGEGG